MKFALPLLFCLVFLAYPLQSLATEQIALDTGQECGFCHLDPSGGGELTTQGEKYLNEIAASGESATSVPSKIFRLLVGYLHLLFAVFWFGTILYVHLVLKPAYAAHGLPRGEKIVGVASFWIVGITGAILTSYRVDNWQMLLETRFGNLLLVKVGLYLTMLVSAILVIKVIGPRLKSKKSTEHIPGKPFTVETLQKFDGKEGRPCYFAYQGKVYDAGESRLWPAGDHMKRHAAGTDLTTSLPLAPHDVSVMERLPVVGDYQTGGGDKDANAKAFFFVAYMNLIIVLLILFIIALWRWGWS